MADDIDVSRARTVIAYDGPDLATGEMDVRDLAPALLSIGQLCQQANKLLNGDRAEMSVRVQADFRQGSFEVVLDVIQSLPAQIKDALLPKGMTVQDATAILQYLGLYGSAGIVASKSVLALIRWLRGLKPKAAERIAPDQIRVENHYGEQTIVNNGTMILLNDQTVRTEMMRVVRPVERKGIDTFEVLEPESRQVVETVTKADALSFRSMTAAELQPEQVPIHEGEADGVFQIVSPVFREDNKWKLSNGQADFWAEIRDDEFLTRVHRHEQLFGEGDLLRCRYHTATFREGAKLRSDISILRVIEVVPPDASTQAGFL
jgi:hypothetical protein